MNIFHIFLSFPWARSHILRRISLTPSDEYISFCFVKDVKRRRPPHLAWKRGRAQNIFFLWCNNFFQNRKWLLVMNLKPAARSEHDIDRLDTLNVRGLYNILAALRGQLVTYEETTNIRLNGCSPLRELDHNRVECFFRNKTGTVTNYNYKQIISNPRVLIWFRKSREISINFKNISFSHEKLKACGMIED